MIIPTDYTERVYAGVLGKIIGVYLGRPFEGWSHERIMKELGEINYYVHDKLNQQLVVSDDDISGTFTFPRALEDYGNGKDLTAAQIGQTWLNYIIENKTILWWGGLGMSTENTAFLRLKSGIPAPRSGSKELNGPTVAEQIGSQIFIDGWAMCTPGDPELAANLARKAASVSHDGEAIYGAVVLAAMEALAFVERRLDKLLDVGISCIPRDSIIYRLIDELRNCCAKESDWHQGLALIHKKYSYAIFGGGCHIVPNHAIVMLGLLWGNDDFHRSLMIANTAGYDTDCNSGNVGCLMGIKNGLACFEGGPDWRGPVADRLVLPTADGGRYATDAVMETYRLVNYGLKLAGQKSISPKNGARFHFELPGSMQGFVSENRQTLRLENVERYSVAGKRSLALRFNQLQPGHRAAISTLTFITKYQAATESTYNVQASPTLYPGHTVRASLLADSENREAITCGLFIRHFNEKDELAIIHGPEVQLKPGQREEIGWIIPPIDGQPIGEIGIELKSQKIVSGNVYLDYLTWRGVPNVLLKRPEAGGTIWSRAWVNGVDNWAPWNTSNWIQNEGRGLLIQGSREWTDYSVSSDITIHMAKAGGLGARVQGMKRYYALLFCRGRSIKLIKMLDGERMLAEKNSPWEMNKPYHVRLDVQGNQIKAWVNEELLFSIMDHDRPLLEGAIAMVCEEGRGSHGPVVITPV